MRANDIINNARNEIKDFIIYELGLLYSAKGWQDNDFNSFGDMYYEFDRSTNLAMDVWVSDYEGNDYQELRHIENLVVNGVDNTFFVETEEDREYYFSEIDIDTLVRISNIIETDYKETIKKEI
jgi:hypothetical protein